MEQVPGDITKSLQISAEVPHTLQVWLHCIRLTGIELSKLKACSTKKVSFEG